MHNTFKAVGFSAHVRAARVAHVMVTHVMVAHMVAHMMMVSTCTSPYVAAMTLLFYRDRLQEVVAVGTGGIMHVVTIFV